MISLFRRLFLNKRGVAAIEFALIAPIMITLYIGSVETTNLLLVSRKATNIANTTADLVAQAETIDDDDIAAVFEAVDTLIAPYPAGPMKVIVTSVVGEPCPGDPEETCHVVGWSQAHNDTAYSAGDPFTLRDPDLVDTGESLIVSEVEYAYAPAFHYLLDASVTLEETFALRPRRTAVIDWAD